MPRRTLQLHEQFGTIFAEWSQLYVMDHMQRRFSMQYQRVRNLILVSFFYG
jgi:hypothetical protein